MTAVNEHLNRQNLASNCGQQVLSNDNELFCLTNALVGDFRQGSTLNGNQQFHQQALHNLNGPALANLSNSQGVSSSSLQSGNCLTMDGKKCDLNNNLINGNGQLPDGLMAGKTGRMLNRANTSLEESQVNCMNNSIGMLNGGVHHLPHNQSNGGHPQSDDYSERINKSNSLAHNGSLPVENGNCRPYAHPTLHPSHPNHPNHLNHPLNGNSLNKLAVSGRRGRPPKKDSKSRNRQNRGKRLVDTIQNSNSEKKGRLVRISVNALIARRIII